MFRNYFKVAFRNLTKNRLHSILNIGGLSVGMAVAILIGIWIGNEVSYDRQLSNYHQFARVAQHQLFDGKIETWQSQPRQLAPVLQNEYGNLFKHVVLSSFNEEHTLAYDSKKLGKRGNFMQPAATDLLELKMLSGSRKALTDPNSILLSQSAARTFFGNEAALNQLIRFDNKSTLKVAGVYEDLPQNSSFSQMEFLVSWDFLVASAKFNERNISWGNSWFQIFVQVADNVDLATASAKIKSATADNIDEKQKRFKPELFLYPLSKWHLYSKFDNGVIVGGRIDDLWLFGIIGGFVLILACINFMNLSTARSEKRAKEVGIRKAIGSMRGQLIGQFFSESLVVAIIAFILSLGLVQLALPWFSSVNEKEILIPWNNARFWIIAVLFTLLTGLIAGAYPALYLSSFKPVKVLKGVFKAGTAAAIPRKVLVVLQFTVSVTLIICTVVVIQQIQFGKKRPIGFDNSNLVAMRIKTDEIKNHYNAFREELLQTGAVINVTESETTVSNAYTTNSGLDWRGKPAGMQDEFVTVATDHHFGKTFNWTVVDGRDFNQSIITDSLALILNETAAKYMGFKNPIGEQVKAFGQQYHIVGVVKDMVLQSPYEPVKPMFYYVDRYNRINYVITKINPNISTSAAIAKIQSVFAKYDPENPFDYRIGTVEFNNKFKEEEKVTKLASAFTGLAIFISCLGLFGMASFMAERRTKEIGVRKVLGATVFSLWRLLSKEFVILVLISILIATPISIYFMTDWLQNYQYHTTLSWWIFAITGLTALLITLLTVSYQSIRAAHINPVKSLRSE